MSNCRLHHALVAVSKARLRQSLSKEYGSVQDAFFHAALNGDCLLITACLQAGAELEQRHYTGNMALHLAAEQGHTAVVRTLLAAGADKEARNNALFTPIGRAAECGQAEVVEELIADGANPNAANFRQQTPLMFAIARGHYPVAEALVKGGADINAKDKFSWGIAYFVDTYIGPGQQKKYRELLGLPTPQRTAPYLNAELR